MQQLVLGSEEFEVGDMASFNRADVVPQHEVASLKTSYYKHRVVLDHEGVS
jgi:hypothetical protein